MKGMAEMTANFLIPCLSIAEICKSFKIGHFEIWLPILIYCLFNVGIGYIIAEIICFFIKDIKPEIRKLIIIVCMFSNSTSMQLIYVESLSSLMARIIQSSEQEAKSRGYVIVLLYTIFVNFLRWSIGYNLMKPEKKIKSYLGNSEENDHTLRLKSISPQVTPNDSMNSTMRSNIENLDNLENFAKEKKEENVTNPSFIKIIKEGINMPFISGMAAIIISSTPYINTFFSDAESVGFKLLTGKLKYLTH
jgi:predicted permease